MATQGQPGAPLNSNKISIITKSEIRYEGILYHINPQDQNITLCNVKSFGTEGRRPGDEIAPSPQVHEYIIFRGTDIKDLKVLEAAPQPADPLAGANTQPQTSQQTVQKEQPKEPRQDMKQGGNQEEFDFGAMQSKFEKLTHDYKGPEVKNYKQDDFFDSLSTSTADKQREAPFDRVAQKKTDKETFGSEYVDQAGNRGGRGGFRRGGNRGGGRGGYNRGGHGGGRGNYQGGNRNYEGGNRNYEGGNRNYQGGNRNYEGGNRNYEGGNRNYEGGNRNYEGGNRNYEGGNRNYEGGNRNYEGGNRNYEGGNRNYEGGNRNYEGGNRNYGGSQGGQRRYGGGNQGGRGGYGGGNRGGYDRNQDTFGGNYNQRQEQGQGQGQGNFYKTYESKQQDQGQKKFNDQNQLF